MARSLRSKHAHRRSTRVSTLRRVRVRIKVHHHHHRRYAGIRGGVGHRLMVRRAAKGRAVAASHRRHPHKGYHGPRKRHSALVRRKAAQHRRHGYHLKHPRKRGYHLKHKRRHAARHKGYHLKHKVHRRHGYHVHRRKGLKHPHKGFHGHRHFKHHNTWHRKKSRPQTPAVPLSSASYLSMF
jgi:hypothetical protein